MALVCDSLELLRMALAEGVECRVEGFEGDFRWLSNFFPAPVEVERISFPTVEHAYQAAKTADRTEREKIAALETPGRAKRAGAKLPLREGWEAMKVQVMEELILLKFRENPGLCDQLLATGDCYLEETNTWGDCFWGVCKGAGENHLGRILMRVRALLRAEGQGDARAKSVEKGQDDDSND